ncbi:hypothetical protein Ahy_A03g014547 [Arachis hypogaea]|uniref:Aminotransferase-like plant mobile domain-containing protein n=1 Tax=Arachis hypogaea TaxID=3818 RepID=A0A445DY30_ARAHY|nr:hypothetical protein Ahy_A03g014547 [Arachis hypogaea]
MEIDDVLHGDSTTALSALWLSSSLKLSFSQHLRQSGIEEKDGGCDLLCFDGATIIGYEHEMYRLDQAEHIAGRLDRVVPRILRTRRNLITRLPEQSQTKWTVKLTWFHNTVCRELEQDAIEERLMRYTEERWLPLLEDLDACGRLSWDSAVLAWLYRQMCRATEHGQRNLGGCVSLMLSWAYHRIPLVRPDGFDACRFSLVERWVQYRPDNATGESRLRQYRRTLNGIEMLNLVGLVPPAIAEADASAAVVCPLLCFAIVEWHQVDRVVHQFNGLRHIPTRPLNIDDMHRLDGRFGLGEWFPHLLGGWHEM